MFKSLGIRCRRHTCKVILLTSLVWCVLDILILLTYSGMYIFWQFLVIFGIFWHFFGISDCSNGMGWGCHSATDNSNNAAGHNSANHAPGMYIFYLVYPKY